MTSRTANPSRSSRGKRQSHTVNTAAWHQCSTTRMRAARQLRDNAGQRHNSFPSQGDLNTANSLDALGLAVPALIGMFWGAPLVAREFETGTLRLVWTQGVTRVRWLAAKLGVAGMAAITAGELFSLMVDWWSSPIRKANLGDSVLDGISHSGIARPGTRRSGSPSVSPSGSSSATPCPRWPSPSPSTPPSSSPSPSRYGPASSRPFGHCGAPRIVGREHGDNEQHAAAADAVGPAWRYRRPAGSWFSPPARSSTPKAAPFTASRPRPARDRRRHRHPRRAPRTSRAFTSGRR